MEKIINPEIFKTYDIRGVYPDDLTEEVAHKIGQAFSLYIKFSPIIVGCDSRISSPALKEAVIQGLTDQGTDVIDIGLCTTSCFYFTVGNSQVAGGVMVTASHASKEFNGFKMVLSGNTALTKEQLLELKEIILGDQFPASPKKGGIEERDPTDNYVKAVKDSVKEKIKPLKVIMDAGNGTAGLYIEKIFSNTGLEVIPMFIEPDGNFPNHETNPKIPENRVKLLEKIAEEKADLGFMFDGDADRVGIFDRHGYLVDYSLVLALIAEYRVKNSPKKKVVVEVRTSKIVRDWVEKAGGSVEISECWTIPIKLLMQADPEIVFGGETSGHYIFPELHDTDDGIYGALTFLQAISAKEDSIDEIISEFKKDYFVLEETNFRMADMSEGDRVLERIKNKYEAEGAKILLIDGVSGIFPDWSFNLRQSQSEPVIRLNLEAKNEDLFKEKSAELVSFLESK